ncbi:MAG: metallophosphoesterase [Clostridiales bacterium]|nr:metallophosphoesterase [Clostridiales bacterium]
MEPLSTARAGRISAFPKGERSVVRSIVKACLLTYAAFCAYVGIRLIAWLSMLLPAIPVALFWVLYGLLHSSVLLARVFRIGWFSRVAATLSNGWLGFFLFFGVFMLVADAVRLACAPLGLRTLDPYRSGWLVLIFAAGSFLLAAGSALCIATKEYDIRLDKPCRGHDQLTIAVFSDLHLGKTITGRRLEKVVARINDLRADLVFIAGDFFDNDIAGVKDLPGSAEILSGLKSTYGTFACLGNHDVDLRIRPEVDDIEVFFAQAGVTLLRDEAAELEGFTVVGRKDFRPIGPHEKRLPLQELMQNVDLAKPVFMLDHQPEEIREEAEAGIDLTVCGHTHNGQLFPGGLVTRRLFANAYGHLDLGGRHSVVTSGVGTWGPPLRTASRSEIVKIRLTFGGEQS